MADREGYVPDHGGIQQLLNSQMVQAAALRAAQTVQRTAETIAPRDSGTYSSGFRTRPLTVPTLTGRGGREMRAGATVENTSPNAGIIEARHHVLSRAAKGVRN